MLFSAFCSEKKSYIISVVEEKITTNSVERGWEKGRNQKKEEDEGEDDPKQEEEANDDQMKEYTERRWRNYFLHLQPKLLSDDVQ